MVNRNLNCRQQYYITMAKIITSYLKPLRYCEVFGRKINNYYYIKKMIYIIINGLIIND